MSVVANIAINVDSTKAVSQLNAVDRAADGLSSNTSKLQQAFGGLNTALAGLGLGALIKDLTSVGIDSDRTGKRIQNLAGSSGEAGKLLEIASKAAKSFGLSNLEAEKGVADLYGRLRPAGVALKDIETVYNGVNKAALAAGLSNADTSGVFLQLSQALGSGALQGDELRSIMERMPAVGQAVAKVMGVTVGEVKKLGSEGKITTDVMIKAAAELNKLTPPPPDPFKLFNAEMENLRVELGENILPILTPFVQLLLGVVKAFSAMPEPLQTVVVALGLIVTAILAIGSAVAFLAPVIAAFKTLAITISAVNIGGIIAGWLPVIVSGLAGVVGAVKAAGALILAVFSGPVGWTVLAVAAVVAMAIFFRKPLEDFAKWLWNWGEPIRKFWMDIFGGIGSIIQKSLDVVGKILGAAFKTWLAITYQIWVRPWINLWNNVLRDPVTKMGTWIKDSLKGIVQFFNTNVISPITKAWTAMAQLLPKAMKSALDFVQKAWSSMVNGIKGAIRNVLQFIASNINRIGAQVNRLISSFNRLPGPDIPFVPTLSVPAFAKGGYVDGGTLAMVGEAGPEYIIPESKMAAAAANYLSGARGSSVIPSGNAQINVTTGPVMQMDGNQYVTMADLERAMRQTAEGVMGRLRTPAARQAIGMR
jgi:tape measure domain-containing protein